MPTHLDTYIWMSTRTTFCPRRGQKPAFGKNFLHPVENGAVSTKSVGILTCKKLSWTWTNKTTKQQVFVSGFLSLTEEDKVMSSVDMSSCIQTHTSESILELMRPDTDVGTHWMHRNSDIPNDWLINQHFVQEVTRARHATSHQRLMQTKALPVLLQDIVGRLRNSKKLMARDARVQRRRAWMTPPAMSARPQRWSAPWPPSALWGAQSAASLGRISRCWSHVAKPAWNKMRQKRKRSKPGHGSSSAVRLSPQRLVLLAGCTCYPFRRWNNFESTMDTNSRRSCFAGRSTMLKRASTSMSAADISVGVRSVLSFVWSPTQAAGTHDMRDKWRLGFHTCASSLQTIELPKAKPQKATGERLEVSRIGLIASRTTHVAEHANMGIHQQSTSKKTYQFESSENPKQNQGWIQRKSQTSRCNGGSWTATQRCFRNKPSIDTRTCQSQMQWSLQGAKEIDTRTCQSQMQWAQVQRMSQINHKHAKRHTGRQLNPAKTKDSTLESSQNLQQNTKIKIAKQPQ